MPRKVDTVADWVREAEVLEITALGGTALYAALALFLLLTGKQGHALVLFAAYATSMLLAALSRLIYFKPRPERREFTTLFGRLWASAFPSLHAIRAFCYAVIFGSWAGSAAALAVFLLIAALVAWTRVKLKKHDWVDIGVGAVIGVVLGEVLVRLIPA